MNFTFATVVNEKYQRFIPVFCWFFLKTFPECKIHLFLTERLKPEIKELLAHVYTGVGGIIQIDYNFKDFPKHDQALKSIRWIIPIDYFTTNVYIGDIDMLIVDETLPEQHVKHCMKHNLCYSNAIRKGEKRLTGLHWCMYEYFVKMQGEQQMIAKLLQHDKIEFRKDYRNEHLLYEMVEAGIGKFPNDDFRPHHGIHLGIWKDGRVPQEKQLKNMFHGQHNYGLYIEKFNEYIKDPNFQIIAERSDVPELTYFKQWLKSL